MGLDVVALNPFVDPLRAPRAPEERDRMIEELKNTVTALKADLGVFFEHSGGETISLVSPDGEVIEGFKLLLFFAKLLYETGNKGDIATYIFAPSAVDELAQRYGGKVIRTRPLPRYLLEASRHTLLGGNEAGGLVFSKFQPAFDSIFALGMILQCLAKSEAKVPDILKELPHFHLKYTTVPCPWQEKGRVVRILLQELGTASEYGILVREHSKKWVLILPDVSESYFHIWAEGETEEEAKSILKEKRDKVEMLISAQSTPL
jgi:mannose-1-phosphate guanylyltransferase/phosphomannomutase